MYVTDSLQAIPQQKHIVARYEDFIHKNIDTRTADEIVIDVMSRAGLKPKGGD